MKLEIGARTLSLSGMVALCTALATAGQGQDQSLDGARATQGQTLAQELTIVDANILTSYRLTLGPDDIIGRSRDGEFDLPRARQGGLNLAVMGMLVPSKHAELGDAKQVADQRVDEMLAIVSQAPDDLAVALSRSETSSHTGESKLALMLAIENGAAVENDLANLQHFHDRGVRLITIVHSSPNQIGDSSFSNDRPWNGLSPFGREVVVEMNRLGLIIDLAHIADTAFDDVLDITKAPVVVSHTSCRHFTPGWERNLDDSRIEKLAGNGGVLHIAFSGSFLSTEQQKAEVPVWEFVEGQGLSINSDEGRRQARSFRQENGIGYASVSDVADHIDHAVALAGIDHVGLGSGFDGSGDSMPADLSDVSAYPNLVQELVERGYTRGQLEKILAGNFLRVWSEVERIAREQPSTSPPGMN